MEEEAAGDFVTLTPEQLQDPYQAGYTHGKQVKLNEILEFQAREHALFISGQLSFFNSFLSTLRTLLPLFKLSQHKLAK